MPRGLILALAVLLGGASLAAASPAVAATTPRCHGKAATIVMAEPGTVSIEAANAVVVGSNGNDAIYVLAPNVLVCAGGGDDYVLEPNGTAVVYLGSGNDFMYVSPGTTGYGESGNDQGRPYGPGAIFHGGSGDDVLYVEGGATGSGDSGNDYLVVTGGSSADGGSGNDDIRAGGAAALYGGSGNDTITIWSGDPTIDCGSNVDTLVLQVAVTAYRRCEVVQG